MTPKRILRIKVSPLWDNTLQMLSAKWDYIITINYNLHPCYSVFLCTFKTLNNDKTQY